MDKCSRCGSLAINHNCHDRDGKDGDLCDVCYWRKRAEKAKAELQEKLRQQRIACADVWVSECYEDNKCTDVGKFMYEAILNAEIDKRG